METAEIQPRLRRRVRDALRHGRVSITFLARHTGLHQSHLSNFLNERRNLSCQATDRVLAVLQLGVEDLADPPHDRRASIRDQQIAVPIVDPHTELFEPRVPPKAIQTILALPSTWSRNLPAPDAGSNRYGWLRFVGVQITSKDAEPMHPVLLPGSVAVIDRWCTSLLPGHSGPRSAYALYEDSRLIISYIESQVGHLVLRPHDSRFPVRLLQTATYQRSADLIVGRVAYILNPA